VSSTSLDGLGAAGTLPPEVSFFEGMSLMPQHFQLLQAGVGAQIRQARRIGSPHNWGFLSYRDRVDGRQFTLAQAEVLFPRGAAVSIPGNADAPGSITIPPNDGVVEVFLAIPDAPQTAPKSLPSDSARFRYSGADVSDEHEPFETERVEFRLLTPRLFLADQLREGWESVKVAEFVGESSDGVPKATHYTPPLLDIAADPELLSLVDRVIRRLGQELKRLSSLSIDARPSDNHPDAGGLEVLLWLHSISTHYEWLRQTCVPGVHPFDVYRVLCSLCAGMSVFARGERDPISRPKYDHERIWSCFDSVVAEALELDPPDAESWIKISMKRTGQGCWECEVDRSRFADADKRVLLRVEASEEMPDSIDRLLLGTTPPLKLAAGQSVDAIRRRVTSGIKLKRTADHPGLPNRPRMHYFRIRFDPGEFRSTGSGDTTRLVLFSEQEEVPDHDFVIYCQA
jgi:type VI secretion system ImpJ/VasE family protein